ncbi:UNVERIFIED_CONTAM: hypothetical protein HDU68_006159, partial [Siphonaria sp. JEL0065]
CGDNRAAFEMWRECLDSVTSSKLKNISRLPRAQSLRSAVVSPTPFSPPVSPAPLEYKSPEVTRTQSLRQQSPPIPAQIPRHTRSVATMAKRFSVGGSDKTNERPTSNDYSVESIPSLTRSNSNRLTNSSGDSSSIVLIAPTPSSRAYSNLPTVLEHRAASLDIQPPSSLRFPDAQRRNVSLDVPRSELHFSVDHRTVEGMKADARDAKKDI